MHNVHSNQTVGKAFYFAESKNHILFVYIHNVSVALTKLNRKQKPPEEPKSYACQMHESLSLEYLKIYMNKYYKLPLALFIVNLKAIS